MSWRATAYVAELIENLTPAEKLVLMCLANRHHQDTGKCNPSIPRLAEESLTSESNLYRLLAKLRAKGFIEWSGGGGRGRSNEYEIVGVPGKAGTEETANPRNMRGFNQRSKTRNPRKSDDETLSQTLSNNGLNPLTAMRGEQVTDQQGAKEFAQQPDRPADDKSLPVQRTASSVSVPPREKSFSRGSGENVGVPDPDWADDDLPPRLRLLSSRLCDACGEAFTAAEGQEICGACLNAYASAQRDAKFSTRVTSS